MNTHTVKLLLVVALVHSALIASCASSGMRAQPLYVKPGVTEAKMKEELASCRADSEETLAEVKKGVAQAPGGQIEFVDQCMKAKGFSPAS